MKQLTRKQFIEVLYAELQYFDNLCKKNNIHYSLIGGSLIGAIREKGIIPWDDDIDIILTKENYKKLQEAIKGENGSRYRFLTPRIDKTYNFPFIKLVDTATVVVEPQIKNNVNDYGVYIDIFFYCYTSDYCEKQVKHCKKINSIARLCNKTNINYDKASISKKAARLAKNSIISIMGNKRILKLLNNEFERYDGTDHMISCWPIYNPSKEIQESSDIDAGYIDAKFGPVNTMIFKNYDNILKRTFGDYMTPPSKDKRKTHGLKAYWKDET